MSTEEKGNEGKRVLLLSGNPLCRNPRVLKEAICLSKAGYSVEVLGAWTRPELRAEDQRLISGQSFRFTPVVDWGTSSVGRGLGGLRRFLLRARVRGSIWLHKTTQLSSVWQFGPVVGELKRAAMARRCDLAIAHSEAALAATSKLLESGWNVGIDFEDWFSEDLLPEMRKARPLELLRALEKRVAKGGTYVSCPSRAMANALSKAYGCAEPTVVYNAFPWADRETMDGRAADRARRVCPSIHWYSQTLGRSRGLEDLLSALPMLTSDWELHLRGELAEGFEEWMLGRLPERWRSRVFLHGLVSNESLLSRIAEHDIGFAGEMKYCKSRELTVTNKILHYLLGGLAVIASDTQGQAEVASAAPDAVSLYPSGDSRALAGRLESLLGSAERLGAARKAALAAAQGTFNWELQQGRLLERVGAALAVGSLTTR